MQQLTDCCNEAAVQPIDQYPIYELGAALQALKSAAEVPAHQENAAEQYHLWFADFHLDQLLNNQQLAVSYCRVAAEKLRRSIRILINKMEKGEDDKKAIEPWQWHSLKNNIDIFEHQFSAELKMMSTYAVQPHGIFNTSGLVEGDVPIDVEIGRAALLASSR